MPKLFDDVRCLFLWTLVLSIFFLPCAAQGQALGAAPEPSYEAPAALRNHHEPWQVKAGVAGGAPLYSSDDTCLAESEMAVPVVLAFVEVNVVPEIGSAANVGASVRAVGNINTADKPWLTEAQLNQGVAPSNPYKALGQETSDEALQERVQQAGGGVTSLTAEVVFPIRLGERRRVIVSPYVGAGLSFSPKYDREERIAEAMIRESSTDPALTYGLTLGYIFRDVIEFQVHMRTYTLLVGMQEIDAPESRQLQDFEVDTGTITWAELSFGVAIPLKR